MPASSPLWFPVRPLVPLGKWLRAPSARPRGRGRGEPQVLCTSGWGCPSGRPRSFPPSEREGRAGQAARLFVLPPQKGKCMEIIAGIRRIITNTSIYNSFFILTAPGKQGCLIKFLVLSLSAVFIKFVTS